MFQEAYCISLQRRPQRYQEFQRDLPDPFPLCDSVKKYVAIDGKLVKHPSYWRSGGGAWGCYRSHLRIIEDCLNRGVESVLLMEDDCKFVNNFNEVWPEYLNQLPDNWGMVYLGGQNLKARTKTPIPINKHWYQPYNVNRTHCFGLRGQTMLKVYKHLCSGDWHPGHHIDHHLGRFHQRQADPIYIPNRWLAMQRENKSDICNKEFGDREFNHAEELCYLHTPFVAVLGLHGSGSSITAMVMKELGVHMGNVLVGYHGPNEAKWMARIMEDALPFGSTRQRVSMPTLRTRLTKWIVERTKEARRKGTIAGAKYPQMSAYGSIFKEICNDALKVVNVERPLQDCIRSINKRTNSDYSDHQKFLHERKTMFLNGFKEGKDYFTVNYEKLLNFPDEVINGLVAYLDIEVSEDQRRAALSKIRRPNRPDSADQTGRNAESAQPR